MTTETKVVTKANEVVITNAELEPVRAIQLNLFESEKVLELRLGVEFFRKLPTTSGVYYFWDISGKLLYVGKAKDLRQRLNSYRHQSGASRKTIRMIGRTFSITYELCVNEQAALLRENQLLQTLRPPFNRMHVWPAAYYFLQLKNSDDAIHFHLIRGSAEQLEAGAEIGVYGAFKSSMLVGLQALFRLFHAQAEGKFEPAAIPREFLAFQPSQCTKLQSSMVSMHHDKLVSFLEGISSDLVASITPRISSPPNIFLSEFLAHDVMSALHFFEEGTSKNRKLRQVFSPEAPYIKRGELDSMLIRMKETSKK